MVTSHGLQVNRTPEKIGKKYVILGTVKDICDNFFYIPYKMSFGSGVSQGTKAGRQLLLVDFSSDLDKKKLV